MHKLWTDDAWHDYLYWQSQDKKKLKRINDLIKDIERNDELLGIGKPEALKGDLSGYYNRRIDDVNRIVYKINDNALIIISCRGHYK